MKRYSVRHSKRRRKVMTFLLCSAIACSMPGMSSLVSARQITDETAIEQYGVGTDATDSTNIDANGTLGKNSDIGVIVTKSITGEAGKAVTVQFKLQSSDTNNIKLKSVYPVIDGEFPFETSGDAYKIVSATNKKQQANLSAKYKLTTRSDVTSGYHSVKFIGEYTKIDESGNSTDYYVIKTINIYFEGEDTIDNNYDDGEDDDDDSYSGGSDYYDDDDDSYSDGGSSYYDDDDDDSSSEATAPKLLISGYETKPKKVMAGETFTLTVHVQNTSKTTSVCSGKFLVGNEAGTFLPTNGSNAVFVDKIEPGKTADLKIELKTSVDLPQKDYNLIVKGDFDDGKGNNFTSNDSFTIPVYQEIKLGITDVSLSPEVLGIGEDGALMFTINNQGKAGVYNVNVKVKDTAVTADETYVGNIAAGASAYANLTLYGEEDNSDTGTIKVVITYESADGKKGKIKQEIDCYVSEDAELEEDWEEDWEEEDWEEEEDEGGFHISKKMIAAIAAAVLAVIVIIVLIVVRRKKRMAQLLADDGEDDFDETF